MSQSPSGSDAVGHCQLGTQPTLSERAGQLISQCSLAAKSLAHPANVQQQAFRPVGLFQPNGGTELLAGLSQLHQCQTIGRGIVGF